MNIDDLIKANRDIFLVTVTPGENASNSVGISWHSNLEHSMLMYKKADDFSYILVNPIEEYWALEEGYEVDRYRLSRFVCNVSLTDLEPDTIYIFKIVQGTIQSKEHIFKTAPIENNFTFFSFCDFQYDYNNHSHHIINNFSKHEKNAYLLTCSGDIADSGCLEDTHRFLIDNNCFNGFSLAFSVGDHEYWGTSERPYIMFKKPYSYNKLFNNPKNGPVNYKNQAYYFIYGNTLFISIDCGDSNISSEDSLFDEMVSWLDDVLSNKKQSFVVVLMHKSLFGAIETDHAVYNFSNKFINIFDKHHVDLIISGHDHQYSRTYPLVNKEINSNGSIYLDLGNSGDKTRSLNESLKLSKIHKKTIDIHKKHYTIGAIIKVSNDLMKIEVRNEKYKRVDCFYINKK